MSGVERSIVALYENGLSVEQIASEESCDVMSVKSVLAQHCGAYRDTLKSAEKSEIAEHEYEEYLEQYKLLRFQDDNPVLRERVLRNLINLKKGVTDGLGANDPKKMAALLAQQNAQQMSNANVGILNNLLRAIRNERNKSVIDVTPAPAPKEILEENVA